MLKIAISGCNGKMGKALIQAASNNKNRVITAASLSSESPLKTEEGIISAGEHLNIKPVIDLQTVVDQFDVLIDFTTPQAAMMHLALCQKYQKKWILGTTGLNAKEMEQIKQASQNIAIVFSPNMSIGVNVCYSLLAQAAKAIGQKAEVEIIEAHHRHKVDTPSGTALKMGEIISHSQGYNLSDVALYRKAGKTEPRKQPQIGFSSLRAGDIVGDHTVLFALDGERIEITHRAADRSAFAKGALQAAEWIQDKTPGLYSMADVLGLS